MLTQQILAFNDTFDWPALRRRELLVGSRAAQAEVIESGLVELFTRHGIDEGGLNRAEELALVFVPREFQPEAESCVFVGSGVDGEVFSGSWQPPAGAVHLAGHRAQPARGFPPVVQRGVRRAGLACGGHSRRPGAQRWHRCAAAEL